MACHLRPAAHLAAIAPRTSDGTVFPAFACLERTADKADPAETSDMHGRLGIAALKSACCSRLPAMEPPAPILVLRDLLACLVWLTEWPWRAQTLWLSGHPLQSATLLSAAPQGQVTQCGLPKACANHADSWIHKAANCTEKKTPISAFAMLP